MNQRSRCYHTHAEEELTRRLDSGAISSALYNDKINRCRWQPSNNSLMPKVGSPRSQSHVKLWIILSINIVVWIISLSGCVARNANNSNSVNQNSLPGSTNTSPSIASSPTTASTPVANSAYDGWPLPPLIPGNWVAEDKQASRNLLDRLILYTSSNLVGTARQITQFRTKRLSFYPGAKLCEGLVPAIGSGETSIFSFILLENGTVTLLDGTAAPIHGLDTNVPVALDTREQAETYLRFFSAAIFANGGNFRIVDEVEDPLWARDSSEADKQKAAKYIRPLALDRFSDGRWKANATVQFGTALSSSVFYVDSTGNVEMAEDVTVASDLPLRREAFNGPLRYEIGLYK